MYVYLDLVLLLNFSVDFLLIVGTNRLAGYPYSFGRAAMASCLGAVYAASCLLREFYFLSNLFWRLIFLFFMSVIAFGCHFGAVRRGILFALLSMALGGMAVGMQSRGVMALIIAAVVLAALCILGFRSKVGTAQYDIVELSCNGRQKRIIALRDTGNTLLDPVTGESVLIVGADVASSLLGLSASQLADPIGTVCTISGFRLIPYRSVGKSNGMLLAKRLDDVRINGKQTAGLVAFAPNNFDRTGEYQALTGGVL